MRTAIKSSRPLLSIILVEYKSNAVTARLLKRMRGFTSVQTNAWEVIVVDNNEINRGYGGGLNHGASMAKGEFLLFTNPDVDISERSISRMLTEFKTDSKIGVVGPRFQDPSGETQPTCEQFPSLISLVVSQTGFSRIFSRYLSRYRYTDWDRESSREVEVLNGACMMIRHDLFLQVGRFDESMKLYWEEHDLCMRIASAGFSSRFVATAVATHEVGHSTRKESQSCAWFSQSRLKLLSKLYGVRGLLAEALIRILTQWKILALVLISMMIRGLNFTYLHVFPDLGFDYLQSLDLIRHQHLPLQGIASSIPRFSQGPLQIYTASASMLVFGFHPYALPIFSTILTTFGVVIMYLALSKTFSSKISFLMAGFFAVIPGLVHQARTPYYLHFLQISIPLFLYLISREKLNIKYVGFALALIFQSVLSTIPLILGWSLLLGALRSNQLIRTMKHLALGFSLGILPQLIHQVMTGCKELCVLPIWMVYRVFKFITEPAVSGSTQGIERLQQFIQSFSVVTDQLFGGSIESIIFFTMVFMGAILGFRSRSTLYWFALIGFLAQLIAIIVHGIPSEAYLPALAMLGVVLIGFAVRSQPIFQALVIGVTIWFGYLSFTQTSYNTLNRYQELSAQIRHQAQDRPVELYPISRYEVHATHLDYLQYVLLLSRYPVRSETNTRIGVDLENWSILLYNR